MNIASFARARWVAPTFVLAAWLLSASAALAQRSAEIGARIDRVKAELEALESRADAARTGIEGAEARARQRLEAELEKATAEFERAADAGRAALAVIEEHTHHCEVARWQRGDRSVPRPDAAAVERHNRELRDARSAYDAARTRGDAARRDAKSIQDRLSRVGSDPVVSEARRRLQQLQSDQTQRQNELKGLESQLLLALQAERAAREAEEREKRRREDAERRRREQEEAERRLRDQEEAERRRRERELAVPRPRPQDETPVRPAVVPDGQGDRPSGGRVRPAPTPPQPVTPQPVKPPAAPVDPPVSTPAIPPPLPPLEDAATGVAADVIARRLYAAKAFSLKKALGERASDLVDVAGHLREAAGEKIRSAVEEARTHLQTGKRYDELDEAERLEEDRSRAGREALDAASALVRGSGGEMKEWLERWSNRFMGKDIPQKLRDYQMREEPSVAR